MFSSRKFEAKIAALLLSASFGCATSVFGDSKSENPVVDKGTEAHNRSIVQKQDETVRVELIGATATDDDSKHVLDALQNLLSSLGRRNLDQVGDCLGDDVTVFDDRNHHVVFGKQAVLEHIKANVLGSGKSGPVKSIAVHAPFVRVKGETAMVSFRATKEMANAEKLESWCSEVFERKNGQWLVLQFRSNWKPVR